MKNILIILMATTTLNFTTQAGNKKFKEITLSKQSETINVSAEQLWQIVGPGFEQAGQWSTAVDHAVGVGTAEFEGAPCKGRICDVNVKGFSKINERLTQYEEGKKELTYQIDQGMPGFVLLAQNHWQVEDLGNGQSRIKMSATMHTKKFMGALMGGMMKKNLNNALNTVIRDLKIYAETGNISEEKAKRIAELTSINN